MKLFIGDIIQKLRKIKGLTQEQVANALGITTSSVSKQETNNTYPDISLLSPLARLLTGKGKLKSLIAYKTFSTFQIPVQLLIFFKFFQLLS